MKAAVCYEFGKPLVLDDVELTKTGPNEVLVHVAATAICHTDIHVIRGETASKGPILQGHETAGIVTEVGANVKSVKPGDHVIVSLLSNCGHCYFCITGMPHMCVERKRIGAPLPEGRIRNKKGQSIFPGNLVASFAEYSLVDESQVVKIPNDFPFAQASLLACGVITGFGAVVNRAQVRPMQSAVVIGLGGVGLNAVQGAAISGANPIIGIDMIDSKLEAAKKFGATHGLRGDDKDLVAKVQALTYGRGADYSFITVGNPNAVVQGISLTGPRGWTVVVGVSPQGSTITIPPTMAGEKVLTSCSMGSTKYHTDIPKMIDLYKAGRLKLDELITKTYTLDEINEGIVATEKGTALRNVIVFPGVK